LSLPTVYNQIDDNKNKTWLLMGGFVSFIAVVVWIFARALEFDSGSALSIVAFSFIVTGIVNIVSYYFSDTMVLRLSGARP
jgi:hypothetical protein